LYVVTRHPNQKALLKTLQIRFISEDKILPRRRDMVVEATGSPFGFGLARLAIRSRGTLLLKSTYQDEMTVNWSPFVVDEITIGGSRCDPFAPALRLLERGEVDPSVLFAERLPLRRGLDGFEDAKKPGMLKVLLG
jgi:threonine dehydrogenase-like Zn-dependent dehydrogenase